MEEANKNPNEISPAAIERLRASRQESERKQYTAGEHDGREWTTERAEAEELTLLTAWQRQHEHDWRVRFDSREHDACQLSDEIFTAIWPEDVVDHDVIREFWERESGSEHPSLEYLRGFVNAAIAAWEAIERKL